MAIRFAPSSTKHGITPERSRWVIDHCRCPLYSSGPEEADQVLFLGPDMNGVPLEVLAIELADGDLLVIHAMRMRQKYRDAFAEVMECQ